MRDETFRDAIECDVETYWRCVFDPDYTRRLYIDVLKFRGMDVLRDEQQADVRVRKAYYNPAPSDLPAPIAKAVGDLSWTEEARYDRTTGRYAFSVTPASLPDKTHLSGEIWCEPRGEKRIERFARVHVEVKMMMIGSLIEKKILDDMKKSYEAAARFTGQYAKEKGW